MFNFGSLKNILIMLGIALVIYGVSLLVKLILTKTKNSKIWENYVGKFWTIFVLVISSIIYWILAKDFLNGLMNGILLSGMQSNMFKLLSFIKNLFAEK